MVSTGVNRHEHGLGMDKRVTLPFKFNMRKIWRPALSHMSDIGWRARHTVLGVYARVETATYIIPCDQNRVGCMINVATAGIQTPTCVYMSRQMPPVRWASFQRITPNTIRKRSTRSVMYEARLVIL
jgi:hypothetical protein